MLTIGMGNEEMCLHISNRMASDNEQRTKYTEIYAHPSQIRLASNQMSESQMHCNDDHDVHHFGMPGLISERRRCVNSIRTHNTHTYSLLRTN